MPYISDHDFAIWAFGDVWHEFLLYEKDSIDLMEAWNYRHADLLLLNPEDTIFESMEKMKNSWKCIYEKEKE